MQAYLSKQTAYLLDLFQGRYNPLVRPQFLHEPVNPANLLGISILLGHKKYKML